MEFQDWILTEPIEITVTSTDPGTEDNDKVHTELLIERVLGPGAVLLRINWNGELSANGKYVNLGDDSRYWSIFEHVDELGHTEIDVWRPAPVGFHCEMTVDPSS
jgi:hypothetical protein